MSEIRTRKNARRISQNTDAVKRMLDSFLRSKQAEVASENSETEYAADLMTGGMEDLAYTGSDLVRLGTAKAERPHRLTEQIAREPPRHSPQPTSSTQRDDSHQQPRGRPIAVKPTRNRIRTSTQRISPTPATGGKQVSVQAATQAAGKAQRTRAATDSVRATARKATEAASRAVRDIIAGARTLISALTAGGTVSVIIVVILCLVGLLIGSGFGIFFSGENTDTGQTLQSVIRQVNDEYAERLDELRAGYSYDTVEISGSRAPWQEVLAVYAVHTTSSTDVMIIDDARAAILKDIFWQMHEVTAVPSADGSLCITITHKTPDEMSVLLGFTSSQQSQLAELLSEEYRSLWNAAIYGTDGNADIVTVALSQIGNVGGEPYWSWYGFNSPVEWCACFVSWCSNECGYLEAGTLPRFASCSGGVQWFRERGLWRTGSFEPRPGDIIFFDWADDGQDGSPDHVGIVERVGDGIVYTIEGNSGDACKAKRYSIDHAEILGYGTYNP